MRGLKVEHRLQQPWPPGSPLVTVIIPCYNYGRFLRGAVDSVLAQTFQRFEILVIDDGSTEPATLEILEEFSCEKTRVIRQQNQGLAQTRNNAAAQACGKYICYLDADDLLEPTYLEKALLILESDESLGSCYSWVRCFGERESVWETQDLDPVMLKRGNTSSSHAVIRRQAWEAVKASNGCGYLSKYDGYFEDWVFWIDMLQCGYRGRVIREPLICYRIHRGSLSASHKSGFVQMLKALHEDRKSFFGSWWYGLGLQRALCRRVHVVNNLINLPSGSV